ncbi:MAG: NAD(+) diphosphatase [Treponema sp.]|jgi:NAD+ diphosphatase|nr:NAD(+) diphosphatase [Treponema sp.]
MLDERVYLFQDAMMLMPIEASEGSFFLGISLTDINFSVQFVDIPSLLPNQPNIKIGDAPSGVVLPEGWRRTPMRQVVSSINAGDAERVVRAFHIAQWRRESVYCGVCGNRNVDSRAETARVCPRCGRIEYPRIAPAVITLVTNDEGEILLAHNAKFKAGVYSLIAGFNEAGESLEQTVEREIWEETGLKVNDVCYKISQPWPFPCSLMTGWTARYAGGILRPDGIEIEDVRWFRRDGLPELPSNGSAARRLINEWLSEQTGNF